MRLKITGATSADLPDDFWVIDLDAATGYEAPDPDSFQFELSMDIGPADRETADLFTCVVVTRSRLASMSKETKLLVMERYTHALFVKQLKRRVQECEDETWYRSLLKLRAAFAWEYEGMYSEDELRRLND